MAPRPRRIDDQRRIHRLLTEVDCRITMTMDEEMTAAVRQYHQSIRPGQPTMLTIRELLWLGLGVPVDIATRRAVQHLAIREAHTHVMQRTMAFVHELRADMAHALVDAHSRAFMVPPEDLDPTA